MFTIVYPMFERGRILKKELVLALRDYSFGFARLQFSDYTDGIISGCDISVTGERLTVAPGIIKFNKFVYMMAEPQSVYFEPTEQTVCVKVKFSTTSAASTDFVSYSGNVVLDDNTELGRDEIEICRFKLKRGSKLRYEYTGYEDMQTEYDTINLTHATWAGPERSGTAMPLLRQFAREAIKCNLIEAWDISFCNQCIAGEMVHRSVIEAYLTWHDEDISGEETNLEIYNLLGNVLSKLKRNAGKKQREGRKRPKIDVD